MSHPARLLGRALHAAALATLLSAALARGAAAQDGIRLEVRPRLDDTLRTRLEQMVEMTGTAKLAAGDSTRTATTAMVVIGRIIPERREGRGTRVLAVTDSVAVSGSGSRANVERLRRTLEGKHLHLLLLPDGSAQVLQQPAEESEAVHALVAQMPATLPNHVVSVGDTWQQVMAIPNAGDPAAGQAGSVTTTFRLDSLSGDGRVAHVSLRGSIERGSGALPRGGSYAMSGTVQGRLEVDRQRGWITDSRVTLTTNSTLTPPQGSREPVVKLLVRVTQHLRALR